MKNNAPITVAELIEQLEKLPSETDVYFKGISTWKHGFAEIDIPVTKVRTLKTYSDSDCKYIELFGIQDYK